MFSSSYACLSARACIGFALTPCTPQKITSQKSSKQKFSLVGFDSRMFLHMCILLGVDYLEGLHGVGIITANAEMRRLKDGARVIKHLKNHNRNVTVPPGYDKLFRQAEATFIHQRVWCPNRRKLVHLNEPLPPDFEFNIDECCGAAMDDAEAKRWVGCGADPSEFPPLKALPPLGPRPTTAHPFDIERAGRSSQTPRRTRTPLSPPSRNRARRREEGPNQATPKQGIEMQMESSDYKQPPPAPPAEWTAKHVLQFEDDVQPFAALPRFEEPPQPPTREASFCDDLLVLSATAPTDKESAVTSPGGSLSTVTSRKTTKTPARAPVMIQRRTNPFASRVTAKPLPGHTAIPRDPSCDRRATPVPIASPPSKREAVSRFVSPGSVPGAGLDDSHDQLQSETRSQINPRVPTGQPELTKGKRDSCAPTRTVWKHTARSTIAMTRQVGTPPISAAIKREKGSASSSSSSKRLRRSGGRV